MGDAIEILTFVLAAAIVLGGAIGVITMANPVHSALSLVACFFGVATLFVLQQADFLAFTQVVVYAGAIVVLFLFVIMLLGVDYAGDLSVEPIVNQRTAAAVVSLALLAVITGGFFLSGSTEEGRGAVAVTGQYSETAPIDDTRNDVEQLGEDLFTRNVLAFEATALLLTIATVGAVVLVRNQGAQDLVTDEPGSARR